MKRALFTALAALLVTSPVFAQAPAANVAGDWDVTIVSPQGPNTTRLSLKQDADKLNGMFKTPQGDMPGTATFAVDGDKLTGTFGSQMGEAPITGTLSGKSLKLKLQAQTPQGEMQVDMTGDLDGDAIVNGKAEVMGMQLDW